MITPDRTAGQLAMIGRVSGALLAVHWQNTITLGSVLITFCLGLLALGGIVYATVRKGQLDDLRSSLDLAEHNAEAWHGTFEAEKVARERYQAEAANERVRAAEEAARVAEAEREIRHGLKNDLAAARMELEVLHRMRDVSEVLQNQQLILGELETINNSVSESLANVVRLLQQFAGLPDLEKEQQ